MIVQRGPRLWVLYTRNGSRVLGRHPSYQQAARQEAAIHAHEHARANPTKHDVWYHGGPKITSLDALTWDREYGVRDQNAAGPGMYWTMNPREAAGYGGHLYRATLRPGFRLMPARAASVAFVRRVFAAAGPARVRYLLEDHGEANEPGLRERVVGIYADHDSMLDASIVLYHDLFHHDPNDYVAAMRRLYDGARVVGGGNHNAAGRDGTHLVVWSPAKLTIEEAR